MPLTEIAPRSATVRLNGAGGGTVKLGPSGSAEVWAPAVASFSCSSNVLEAQCKVYVGDTPIAANFVDGSLSGSTGDSTGRVGAYLVRQGQFIWAVWTGGDVGAVATLTVGGMRQV